jgi:hypothetical protein
MPILPVTLLFARLQMLEVAVIPPGIGFDIPIVIDTIFLRGPAVIVVIVRVVNPVTMLGASSAG